MIIPQSKSWIFNCLNLQLWLLSVCKIDNFRTRCGTGIAYYETQMSGRAGAVAGGEDTKKKKKKKKGGNRVSGSESFRYSIAVPSVLVVVVVVIIIVIVYLYLLRFISKLLHFIFRQRIYWFYSYEIKYDWQVLNMIWCYVW